MNSKMCIVTFIMAYQYCTSIGEAGGSYLPWRRRLKRQSDLKVSTSEDLCKLPPYPKYGRYFAIEKLGAKPGEVFQNVSFVLYNGDESNDIFKLRVAKCTLGKWSQSTFQYDRENLYFDPGWCPALCPPSEIDNNTEPASANVTKNYKEIKKNATYDKICKIPSHPDGGSYYTHGLPNVKPGDVFEYISVIRYVFNYDIGLYEMKRLACVQGRWSVMLSHGRKTLNLRRSSVCAIACTSPAPKKPSATRPKVITEQLSNPYLPWRSTLARTSNSEESTEVLCELPAYPKRGTYFVIDEPDAKPGDVFHNVSLLEYANNEKNDTILIKVLSCSSGRWTQSIFQYQSEKVYFNTSWCPLVCSFLGIDNVTDPASMNSTEDNNTKEGIMTEEKLCKIPPYPKRGGYYLSDKPAAGPGYTFKQFFVLHRYVLDEARGIYELKQLTCNEGSWFTIQFNFESDILYVQKRYWCPFLCSSPAAEKLSASRSPKPVAVLNNPYLPWRTVLEERSDDATETETELCELPPYPKNGSYMVANRPNSRPGDVFETVSLVRYLSLNDSHVEVQELNCSYGRWSESIFQYMAKKMYFDTAWCPFLCLPSDRDTSVNVTDTSKKTNNTEEVNTRTEKPCKLPPYPDGGGYYVHDNPGAGPGDTFERFTISQYIPDDIKRFYEIEELMCTQGQWFKTLFRMEDSRLFFKKEMWCSLLCPIFRNSST